jgi:hypothetical protein
VGWVSVTCPDTILVLRIETLKLQATGNLISSSCGFYLMGGDLLLSRRSIAGFMRSTSLLVINTEKKAEQLSGSGPDHLRIRLLRTNSSKPI